MIWGSFFLLSQVPWSLAKKSPPVREGCSIGGCSLMPGWTSSPTLLRQRLARWWSNRRGWMDGWMDVGVGCTPDAIAASRCCGMEDGSFWSFFNVLRKLRLWKGWLLNKNGEKISEVKGVEKYDLTREFVMVFQWFSHSWRCFFLEGFGWFPSNFHELPFASCYQDPETDGPHEQ